VAEYYALKEGCEQAIELGLKSVRFVSDNLMMVNQMNGVYKVKNNDLLPMYRDIQKLLENFDACAFVHVNRELNKEADEEVNLAIDRHFE
jgi:ribonuclease HI